MLESYRVRTNVKNRDDVLMFLEQNFGILGEKKLKKTRLLLKRPKIGGFQLNLIINESI